MLRQKRLLRLLQLIITDLEVYDYGISVFGFYEPTGALDEDIKNLKERYNKILTKLERL